MSTGFDVTSATYGEDISTESSSLLRDKSYQLEMAIAEEVRFSSVGWIAIHGKPASLRFIGC